MLRTSSSLSSRWLQHRTDDFSDLTGLYFSRSQSLFILIFESTSGTVPYRAYLLTYDLVWRVSSLLLSFKIPGIQHFSTKKKSDNVAIIEYKLGLFNEIHVSGDLIDSTSIPDENTFVPISWTREKKSRVSQQLRNWMISFNFRSVEYDFRHFRISCCWCPRRREFCDTASGITIKENPLVSSMIESKRGSRSFSSVTSPIRCNSTSVRTHVYLWREWSSDEDVYYRLESTQIMFDERKVFISIDSAINICRFISIRKPRHEASNCRHTDKRFIQEDKGMCWDWWLESCLSITSVTIVSIFYLFQFFPWIRSKGKIGMSKKSRVDPSSSPNFASSSNSNMIVER